METGKCRKGRGCWEGRVVDLLLWSPFGNYGQLVWMGGGGDKCSIVPWGGDRLLGSDFMATVVTQSSQPIIRVVSSRQISRHLYKSALGASADRSINVIC